MKVLFCGYVVFLLAALQSCDPPCTIPTETPTRVRIVNAVTDDTAITVTIDGKQFGDIFTFNTEETFGYHDKLKDGSPLVAGRSRIVNPAARSSDSTSAPSGWPTHNSAKPIAFTAAPPLRTASATRSAARAPSTER